MLSTFLKFWRVLLYALLNRWHFVLVVCVFVLSIMVISGLDLARGAAPFVRFNDWWARGFEPLFGALTLLVAIAVWFGELRQDWIASLPKRLDVLFLYEGSPLMVCEHADLSSEADIRPLGQQIGLQLAGEQRLNFKAPSVRMKNKGVSKCSKYVDYAVIFELLPKVHLGEQDGEKKSPFEVLWGSDHCVVWRWPFDAVDFLILKYEGPEKSKCLERAVDVKKNWAAELRP